MVGFQLAVALAFWFSIIQVAADKNSSNSGRPQFSRTLGLHTLHDSMKQFSFVHMCTCVCVFAQLTIFKNMRSSCEYRPYSIHPTVFNLRSPPLSFSLFLHEKVIKNLLFTDSSLFWPVSELHIRLPLGDPVKTTGYGKSKILSTRKKQTNWLD